METLAQLVHLNRLDMRSDSSNRMKLLTGSAQKMEEEHLKIEILAALLICNASTLLSYLKMCNLIINSFKIHS